MENTGWKDKEFVLKNRFRKERFDSVGYMPCENDRAREIVEGGEALTQDELTRLITCLEARAEKLDPSSRVPSQETEQTVETKAAAPNPRAYPSAANIAIASALRAHAEDLKAQAKKDSIRLSDIYTVHNNHEQDIYEKSQAACKARDHFLIETIERQNMSDFKKGDFYKNTLLPKIKALPKKLSVYTEEEIETTPAVKEILDAASEALNNSDRQAHFSKLFDTYRNRIRYELDNAIAETLGITCTEQEKNAHHSR